MNDKEKIKLINSLISYWIYDTMFLSSIETKHPAFTLVQKMAEKEYNRKLVITTVLKRIEKELTWFATVLYEIVPKKEQPVFLEEYRGKIKEITRSWIKWGKEKGYLDNK